MRLACAVLMVAAFISGRAESTMAGALHLDGLSGWYADDSKALDLEDAVTLEAWVRPEVIQKGCNRIIDKGNAYILDATPKEALQMTTAAGTIRYDGKLPTDRLSHVAGVFSRSEGIYKLYVDGREVASQGRDAMKKLNVNSQQLKIGAAPNERQCLQGDVPRVTIYNRALKGDEIAALAVDTSHKSHGLPGTVADWFFDGSHSGDWISTALGRLRLRDRPDPARLIGKAPPPANTTQVLWYRHPARYWLEAMPLGNGRLGAMAYGGVKDERIQLNEDTLWSGAPHDYNHPGAFEHLEEIRKLIAEQKFDEAEKLGNATMVGNPTGLAAYQTLGDLQLNFDGHSEAKDYRRDLDMADSMARISYKIGTAKFSREMFISQPDQVMVIRLTCDQPKQLSFGIVLSSPHPNEVAASRDGRLEMTGEVKLMQIGQGKIDDGKHGTRFSAQIRVIAEGGRVSASGNKLTVTAADSVTLVYTAATSYRNYQDNDGNPGEICQKHLDAVAGKSWRDLRAAHLADVRPLFNRVNLDLGGTNAAQRPTDERVAAVEQGADDPLLAAQCFQFGRYLLIAGSRPGTQPLNLVGIWNDTTKPAWGGKWTLNCNAEINYWPVETCNLSECHEPMLRMIDELRAPGRLTAKNNYNCRGWVVHHNTDIWHGTAVVDGFGFGIFPSAGGWLCRDLWEHYDFTRDKSFLARAWPAMKEAAEFYMDFLILDENGFLVTSPSISFEQRFVTPDGKKGAVCAGPTMDMQILRDLFTHCIKASEILGVDAEFRTKLTEVRGKLVPTLISPRTGEIMEWRHDWDHGKTPQAAPLWGLYPGDEITPWSTPELAAAAKKRLLDREPMFGSWCSAFSVTQAARLGDGPLAEQYLQRHMREHVANSLLSIFSKPWGFQIDGNLGVTAGIAEMLLQSHDGIISLLPALPPSWSKGKVTGLRARGGYIVDLEWQNGKVTHYRIASSQPDKVKVRVNGEIVEVTTVKL